MAFIPSAYGYWFPFLMCLVIFGIGIAIAGGLLAATLNLILKKYTFQKLFVVVNSIIIIGLHIYIYLPPLEIIIPDNYNGEVSLIVHPENEENLTVNQDGIGYITQSIFNGTRGDKKPNVFFQNGEQVDPNRIIGYDSLFFYGNENLDGKNALKFKIKSK